MKLKYRYAVGPIAVALFVALYGFSGSRTAWASNNAQNPHTRQDVGQAGDQEGCHNMTPEPGWMTLLIAGAAPAALRLRRRLAR